MGNSCEIITYKYDWIPCNWFFNATEVRSVSEMAKKGGETMGKPLTNTCLCHQAVAVIWY